MKRLAEVAAIRTRVRVNMGFSARSARLTSGIATLA
jgi:hypothetical protein